MDIAVPFDLTPFNTLGLPSRAVAGAVIRERADVAELSRYASDRNLPFHIVGGGSNLVLRDEVPGVVGLMATKGIQIEDGDESVLVTAAAGEDWSAFVCHTVAAGAWGLENLASIPGTVGAAPVQNIGAYGVELADRLDHITVLDRDTGTERRFSRGQCGFSYRQSMLKHTGGRYVVLDVTFRLPRSWTPVLTYPGLDTLPTDAKAPEILERVMAVRASKLPDWHTLGNVGSFFHNPVVETAIADRIAGVPRFPQADGTVKLSAAWLIDKAGLKGTREGGAGIYQNHALIIVNHGGARFADIRTLAERVKGTVLDRFGVRLVQEPIEL